MSNDELDVSDEDLWDGVDDQEVQADFESPSIDETPPRSPGSPNHSLFRELVLVLVTLLAKWSTFYKITDRSFESLLKVLSFFLYLLGKLFSPLAALVTLFPSSVYALKKQCGSKGDKFEKYVVCSHCHTLYTYSDCFETVGSRKVPKNCSHVPYPNHPHCSRCKPCNQKLLSEITLSSGKKHYYPRKVYCYSSLIAGIMGILQKEGNLEACEKWRHRSVPDGTLGDVYDGKIWKMFHDFLATPHNLGLMLNIDWFTPYKHSPYTVGAIYLVVLNLPRSERYKIENVILVGIIPGPGEPSLNLNTYLQLLVDELKELWDSGIEVKVGSKVVEVKAALLCVACDVPAARKVCGFLGHNARLGCSKCTKPFDCPRFGKVLYCGFEDWPLRDEQCHRKNAQMSLDQTSATKRAKVESSTGSRYTALMQLPYFSCTRMHVIDPMHNLFLGSARHMIKDVWIKEGEDNVKISKQDLQEIQKRVDSCAVSSTMGRIPLKIAANFSSFTADQWKAWALIFSTYGLFGILPAADFECWRKFVKACHILNASVITADKVEEGHQLLISFCEDVEHIYGQEAVTINMHLHKHLKDCILDYGPIASFWLYAFERYNGMLGNYPNNNRSIELQLMRWFTKDLQYRGLALPANMYGETMSYPSFEFVLAGSLKDMCVKECPVSFELGLLAQKPLQEYDPRLWSKSSHVQSVGSGRKVMLEDYELEYLLKVYKCMYATANISITTCQLSRFTFQYKQLQSNGTVWGSQNSVSKQSSHILAAWNGWDGEIDQAAVSLRPALVLYYFKHNITLGASLEPVTHTFAYVKWFSSHHSRHQFGYPVEVWSSNIFDPSGPSMFIPFNRIYCQFVDGFYTLNEESVICVCPVTPKFYI